MITLNKYRLLKAEALGFIRIRLNPQICFVLPAPNCYRCGRFSTSILAFRPLIRSLHCRPLKAWHQESPYFSFVLTFSLLGVASGTGTRKHVWEYAGAL